MLGKTLLHGGDYNPEQWLDYPDLLETDIERFLEAKINVVTLGVFSWAKLEPAEGEYNFAWLQKIIDRLWKNKIHVILATPSGARPHWMADKYPEILRTTSKREKNLFGGRHNHCLTSPIYREKVKQINTELANRFENHPAVILWHISNEYSGECHCPLCQNAFREWLKKRYGTIENLNKKWYTTFWSHNYNSFEQVESPSELGETSNMALKLDWTHFISDQTIDFAREEIKALRSAGAKKPTTVNMMYHFWGIDYFKMAEEVDYVSWDSYPTWHKEKNSEVAKNTGFWHDTICSLKRKPFLLMESSAGATNWQSVSKLRKPRIIEAAALQAIAHGADAALYFQMRQARGAEEKFHSAVIDHYGGRDSRTFREVCDVGNMLSALSSVTGSYTPSEAAVIYDWENRWAIEGSRGPRNKNMYHEECIEKNYRGLRSLGINVDVVDQSLDLDRYRLVSVPMQYLFHEGFAEKLEVFVKRGGTLVMGYWSGVVDVHDRCFLGETPHGLTSLLGLRREEIDGLYDWEENDFRRVSDTEGLTKEEINLLKEMKETYVVKNLCEIVKEKDAKVLMQYGKDFYEGRAALLHHTYGDGQVYYVCADAGQDFYDDLYRAITKQIDLRSQYKSEIPEGLEVNVRGKYLFIQNFSDEIIRVNLPKGNILYGRNNDYLEPLEGVVIEREGFE